MSGAAKPDRWPERPEGWAKIFLEGLLREGKHAPFTVLVLTVLAAGAIFYVFPDLKRGASHEMILSQLSKDFHDLRSSVRLDAIRTRIVTLDGQIYQLEREEDLCKRESRSVPQVVAEQRIKLQSEKRFAETEMSAWLTEQAREEAERIRRPPP